MSIKRAAWEVSELSTFKIFILFVCLMIAFPVAYVFIGVVPANATYNRKFASHVTMAYDQATFEGMLTQINIVWEEMNKTFEGFNFETTYNTWWYPDQTYDNSLAATVDYFVALTSRLKSTITEKEQILNGSKTIVIPYNQWYQITLEGFRNESRREGGLDWVIRPAWFLSFAPLAYYAFAAIFGMDSIICIIMIAVLLEIEKRGSYQYARAHG